MRLKRTMAASSSTAMPPLLQQREHRPIRNLHAALGQDIHARLVFIVFFLILNLFHHNTLRLSINILTF